MTRLVAPLGTDLSKSYGEGGEGGKFSSCTNFSSHFPSKNIFSVCKNIFSGQLAVHDFFSLNFPFPEFLFSTSPAPPPPLPHPLSPNNFSNGPSLIVSYPTLCHGIILN